MPSRKPSDLHPLVYPMFRSFVARCTKGLPAHVTVLTTCTFRTRAEQAELYAQGRTKPGKIVTWAPPGSSNHNFEVDGKPASLAFDVVPIRYGKLIWGQSGNGLDMDPTDDDRDDLELWQLVGGFGKAAGLAWAGDWRPGKREFPHFEHPKATEIRLGSWHPDAED
jgi:peptidoglycan LD-endopeptidase CwlK